MQANSSLPSYLLSILLLLLFMNHSLPAPINILPNNGYQITDLTSKDLTTFAFETQDWSISDLVTNTSNSSLCGTNLPLLGGFNIFDSHIIMEKNYMTLPLHSAIYFQIHFAFIDNFKAPDYMTITLNGTSIPGGSTLKTYNSYLTSNICGGSDPDTTEFTIMGSIPHTSNLLDFKIVAKAATGDGSGTLGIRDISFLLVNDSSIISTNSCFRVFDTQLTGLSGECECQKGYYYDSGTCSVCDASCGDCFGPSSSQCYSCVSGFFWNGTDCIQCDSSCASCSGPSDNQCLTCQSGYWLQKNGTCTLSCNLPTSASQVVGVLQVCETICQDSEYFLSNGSCLTSCPSPLVPNTADSNLLCLQPCQTGEFLDWNGNCISNCSSPYLQAVSNSVDVCNLPCDPVSEYLYPNGSCFVSCNGPLFSTFTGGIQWCNSPCGADFLYPDDSCNPQCNDPLIASSTMGIQYCHSPCDAEFIYPDNSCNPQCNSPLIASNTRGIQYCNSPCGMNGFICPNGSCYSQCGSPLISTIYNRINWCSSPCTHDLDYYYPNNGTCQPSCPPSGIIENHDLVSVCLVSSHSTSSSTSASASTASTLTSQEKGVVDQASSVTSGAGATARAATAASSIASSGSPNAINLICFMKMLDYIRYMNIKYPPKLQYFLDGKGKRSLYLSFQVAVPEKIKEKFPNYPLPEKFGEHGLDSSFIVNYWEELFTFVIIFLILAFATLLAFYTKKIKYVGSFFVKVKNVIKWNLMLIVICSNIDSVGVYSSLEFRTTPFNSFLSILGTLICVLVNLVTIFLMGFTLYIIYSLWRSRKRICPAKFKGSRYQETNEKYLSCGVLYLSFREGSLLQRSSMFFILLRIYLFNMVIGYLFDHPLAQAILIFSMSFLMLVFLSVQRPHKQVFELIKAITFESIIFIVNICILILAFMDHNGVEMNAERIRLGDAIIFANFLFNVVAVLFIGIEIILRLRKTYKISKKIKSRDLKYWTKILLSLFGPEEMEEANEEEARKEIVHCDPIRKESIQLKDLGLGLGNESHSGDLEKSIIICLKNTKAPSPISSSHDPLNTILSFEGLGDVGSTKNLLSPLNLRGSILQSFPTTQNLEIHSLRKNSRHIQRPSLSRFLVSNQTHTSFLEIDLIKRGNSETSPSEASNQLPTKEEEKSTCKLSENLLLENTGGRRNRRRTYLGSPSHFLPDQLVNSSFGSDAETPTPKIFSTGLTSESTKFSLWSNFKPESEEKKTLP